MKDMEKGISIKLKVAITSVFFMGILTFAIALIGYKLYHESVIERYVDYADTVLEYAYREAEEYSLGDMISERSTPDGYEKLRKELNMIKDSSDIEYLYAVYFDDVNDIHSLHYAINAKTEEELSSGQPISEVYSYMGKPCEDGEFRDDTLKILQEAVLTSKKENGTLEGYADDYGHMLNGYRVLFDSDGNAVGLICVEIDINRINISVHRYIQSVIIIAVVLTAIIVLIYVLNTKHYLVDPLVNIAKSSDSFIKKMQNHAEPEELVFDAVEIKTKSELRLLADNVKRLADGVSVYMTNLKSVTAEKERIGTELSLATRIQADMLPSTYPAFPGRSEFDIYATMKPAKEVGGDFYDFFLVDNDHLCMVIADVSGKGIPAALFMMASKIIIANNAMLGKSPAQILADTNRAICSHNREEMFITVWVGILTISTGKLTAANAGHEYPAIRKPDGQFELYKDPHCFVVGGLEGAKYNEYELQLSPGTSIFLYTDGVTEAANEKYELYGTERLITSLNKNPEGKPKKILENMRNSVGAFVKEADQYDDLTMLCIEYIGN